MRLAVDAFNLDADRRGMGRLVRQALESLERMQIDVALVYRERRAGGITPRELRRNVFDAVWYPWNAMRFAPHAPAIVTVHDPFAFTYPHADFIGRWREQRPIRRAIRNADKIFAVSSWGASELRRLFRVDPQRIRVVMPPIDAFWRPVQVPSQRPYVLFIAGPDARKNAPMLFKAFDTAFAQGGPELVVAGTLSESGERAFEAMHGAARRVHPTDEQLRTLYSGALAVAVPSLAEGFGMPVVEAMACGAPVLASDATALPEAAGGAALLLPPEDVQAWREALLRVVADDAVRADLRDRSLRRAAAVDRDAYAKALIESVRQLREGVR